MARVSGGEPEALLSIEDLRRRWGASRALIDGEVARGRLRRIKIGGLVRFSVDEITRYERERTSGGAEDREAERCAAN